MSPRFVVEAPATGEVLARLPAPTRADVDTAVTAARDALEGAWGAVDPIARSQFLHGLGDAIDAHHEELARLEMRQTGKPIRAAEAEVSESARVLRYYAAVAGAVGGRANDFADAVVYYSLKEPVGVCAQIVPWNYPIVMAAWKLGPALAAGCAVVLKPDPLTPLTALRLGELATEVGLPRGALSVVPADGPSVGAYLVAHPGVDKVAFTGSTATGEEIARLCARGTKRLTLELGGKSPNVVFADAPLDQVAPAAAYAFMAGAGQACECRSRLLVDARIYERVVTAVADAAGRIRQADPADPDVQVGSLISRAHRERVHGYVQRAVSDGARLVCGGRVPDGPGAFYPPTVLADARRDMEVVQEEVFGPVVAAMPFEDEDEAVALANDTRYGLFATLWTGDVARAHRVASRVKAGQVAVNTPFTARPGIPFGGYKRSGVGRELGLETLEAYLETKSVAINTASTAPNPFDL